MISKTRTICIVQQAYYGVDCVHEIHMKQNATTYKKLIYCMLYWSLVFPGLPEKEMISWTHQADSDQGPGVEGH